jgi:hypothetical protein
MAGRWWMSRPGVDEREIALLPDGAIGEGASPDVRAWRLDGNTLILDGETCRLSRGEDGIWRGDMPWYRHVPVELVLIS